MGKLKFKVGQKVRPSRYGIARNIYQRTRVKQTGVVVRVDAYNCPTVLWEGRKTPISYHPAFVSIDRRQP